METLRRTAEPSSTRRHKKKGISIKLDKTDSILNTSVLKQTSLTTTPFNERIGYKDLNDSLFESNLLKHFPNTALGKHMYRKKVQATNSLTHNQIKTQRVSFSHSPEMDGESFLDMTIPSQTMNVPPSKD